MILDIMVSNVEFSATTRLLSLCLRTALMLTSVFHTGVSSVKADVRCYCNLPVCVTSGYMCKSSLGTCVSDHFGISGDLWQSRHACLELVSTAGQEVALQCDHEDDDGKNKNYPNRLCCREDMCNYFRHGVDPQNPVYRLNHSYMTAGYLSNDDYFYRHGSGNHHHHHNLPVPHHQIWFKAAVIAVPIAGGFILVMLIIMAARMLKADRKRHRQWSELRRRRRFLNTQLIYNDDKTNRGLLFLPKSVSSAVLSSGGHGTPTPAVHCSGSASMGNLVSSNSLYKNVSIAMSSDTACTDSSQDKYFVFDL